MRANPIKRTIASGGVALGTMAFEFNTTGLARLAADAGAEFIIFDQEHTGWSAETIRMLVATAGAADTVPLVRVPTTQYHLIARVLDVGVRGIMVPMVESAEQAKVIADSAKYPPVGKRGAAFGVAHDDYAGGAVDEKMQSANDETLLIAQIETPAGVDNVEGIIGTPGIDVVWIGHFDLTNFMGIPAQFEHPRYLDAVKKVVAAAQAAGKTAGIMAGSIADARWALDQGFRIVAYSGDLWLYQLALREGLTAIRAHASR